VVVTLRADFYARCTAYPEFAQLVATQQLLLGAMDADGLRQANRMLTLDETLFVEHKTDLGDQSSHQLARSVSAFANTMGGWLLIGVTDGAQSQQRPMDIR
jgi:hypothetical protein